MDHHPLDPRRLLKGTRARLLRWHLACLRDERALYTEAGMVGPVYLRNSREMELQLLARLRELEPDPAPGLMASPPPPAEAATELGAEPAAPRGRRMGALQRWERLAIAHATPITIALLTLALAWQWVGA